MIYVLFEIQSHVSLVSMNSFVTNGGLKCLISCKLLEGLFAQAHTAKSVLIIS